MKPHLLLSLLLVLWTIPARALDPHYTHSHWAEAMDHLRAAKTAPDPVPDLGKAKQAIGAMWHRSDHKLDEVNRTIYDIDGAIGLAKKGMKITLQEKEQMRAKINSAITHLQAAK